IHVAGTRREVGMAVAQDKLHPKARAIVDQLASLPRLPTMTPAEARGRPEPLAAAPEAVASVTARTIPGPGGPMPIRIYRPKDALRGALVYFHGGGWVIGSLEGSDGACRALANRSRSVVISIGYRLAPETKFPGPAADMEWFGRHYVRSEADANEPYASVLRADLHGLPPAFVITAECDPLRDDGEAYAEKLRTLGIRAAYKRYPGMFHGFMSFLGVLPEASEAFDDAGAALRQGLA